VPWRGSRCARGWPWWPGFGVWRLVGMSGRVFGHAGLPDEPASAGKDRRYSQSLGRGLAVLGVFTPARPLLGVAEIAEQLGMSRAMTHRYMITLVALGYLEQGSRLPVHCTAIGKLLLAEIPGPEQHGLLRTLRLARRGPNTITSKAPLRQELEEIKQAGLAISDQELAPGLFAIAVPVRDAEQEVIAAIDITVRGRQISLDELLNALAPELLATGERIFAGHRPGEQR
jgi:DNA-binding IclR family transcriptional regulator